MLKVEHIRQHFLSELKSERFVTDKTGVKTIEMIGATFEANEPAIFGVPNEDYIQRELEWYKSKSLYVKDIPGGKQEASPPEIWTSVACKEGKINSNYGWAIWSTDNYGQYGNALRELQDNPNSRRAVMIYTRPKMWWDYSYNGRSDFMCTNVVQYMIRDDELIAIVQMRSNDVVFGYRNDFAWQDYVVKQLAFDLGIQKTKIIWHVGSLHVYSRHFNLVK
jgi:thymidylate synthase